MTPSAPSETRAASSSSPPAIVRSEPSGPTSSTLVSCRERFGSAVPVPCVPVASAPASDWASMSPRFGIASPRTCSSRDNAFRRIPASTRTRPSPASSTRLSASSESSVPSVTAPALKEWPAPATRTGPGAVATISASSWRDLGLANRAGAARREPDQLTHSTPGDGTVRVMDVSPERVAELQRERSIQLIDIREPYEWEAGRIPGARFLTMGELTAQAETIDRETPVVFYCRVGGRSTMAANAFRRAGYDAYTMTGGLVEWEAQGLPLEPDDGHVAGH